VTDLRDRIADFDAAAARLLHRPRLVLVAARPARCHPGREVQARGLCHKGRQPLAEMSDKAGDPR